MKRQILEIDWVDSTHISDWQDPSYKPEDDLEVKTIGYLLVDNPSYIAVVQSVAKDGQINAIMQIPKKCIKKIKKV